LVHREKAWSTSPEMKTVLGQKEVLPVERPKGKVNSGELWGGDEGGETNKERSNDGPK